MKIAFFSEAGYQGKVPRANNNMRTDLAWVCALNATHHNIMSVNSLSDNLYDIGIIIVPKNKQALSGIDLVSELKRVCKKIGTMQESTYWYWQDSSIESQIWYYTFLQKIDFILCHNDIDLLYYKGITDTYCDLMPSLMITDFCKTYEGERSGVMVGGNWVSAYRGIDSYVIGKILSDNITSPTTGRMKPEERNLDINHLPWINWLDWIYELSKKKYGVQLGTAAAGTFNLNCSYLGIPCISYNTINTQKYLHPELSVDDGDILRARKLAMKLREEKDFYDHCSLQTKKLYEENYSETVFLEKMNSILQKILSQ